jgi:hypothetical protein
MIATQIALAGALIVVRFLFMQRSLKRILEEINLYKPNIHYNYWVFIFIIFSKRSSNLMSEQTIDLKKRRFLTNATSVVGAVGVGFVAWPFLSTWNPSARAKAAGAPIEVDISKLEEGQLVRVLWRKKPVDIRLLLLFEKMMKIKTQ